MLQYGANLLNRDAGEPLNELRYERAVFEVLEERCHRHSSAAKHPSPTHALRIAFDGRACGPINHDVNDTTRTQTTKTANARAQGPADSGNAAVGRSPAATGWASNLDGLRKVRIEPEADISSPYLIQRTFKSP